MSPTPFGLGSRMRGALAQCAVEMLLPAVLRCKAGLAPIDPGQMGSAQMVGEIVPDAAEQSNQSLSQGPGTIGRCTAVRPERK